MCRKHRRRYQGRFTRLASLARSLTARAAAGLLLTLATLLVIAPASAQAQGNAQSATYTVTFTGKFAGAALASGVSVPSGEHFTTLIGAVHNGSVTFWSDGGTASAGIESMAEVGGTSTFKSEINAAMPNALAVIEQSIASGGTATATVDITLTTDHPLVTLTSMVAPSPDWFVGVSELSLRNTADDGWQPTHSVDLFPYDAGTEEGTEFSLTNDATSPQGTIASIKGTGKFSNEPIATLVFDLLAAPVITTTSPILVPENETAVATLTASDDDTPIADLTWTIPSGADGGADADHFTLSEGGILAFSAAKDYEAPDDADADRTYEVTVQVSDGTETDSADLVVTLENVVELTAITGPSSVEFPENSWSRVATFTASSEEDRAGIAWTLGGTDAAHFSIDNPPGALRFALDAVAPRIFSEPPDFEAPVDGDAANTYELTLSAAGGGSVTDTHTFTVTVTDVDEEGALSLSSTRPALGAALRAVLSDPDGVTAGTALWQWERSTGRNAWAVIDGAAAASYTPVAADTNTFLRVTATYEDEHGTGKTVSEVAPNVVTGPLLTGLTAESDDSRADTARGLYPAFDPLTLHYGIGCNGTDTLVLTVSAAANARVGVAGVQAASAPMAVDVSEDSDVAIRVTDASGAGTTYVVHCLPEVFFEIETHTFPNTDAFEDLILFSRAGYFTLMDRNGVPRLRRAYSGLGGFAIRFHRVGADGAYRYGFWGNNSGYTILDEDFEVVADNVRTVEPLTPINPHDFQILEDGNYLLMAIRTGDARLQRHRSALSRRGRCLLRRRVGRGGPDRHARPGSRLHLGVLGQHGHRGLRATPLPRDALHRSRHEESRMDTMRISTGCTWSTASSSPRCGVARRCWASTSNPALPGGRALADGPHQPERRGMGGAGHRPAAAGLHQRSRRRVLRPAHGALPAQRQRLPVRQRRGVRDRSVDVRRVGPRGERLQPRGGVRAGPREPRSGLRARPLPAGRAGPPWLRQRQRGRARQRRLAGELGPASRCRRHDPGQREGHAGRSRHRSGEAGTPFQGVARQ